MNVAPGASFETVADGYATGLTGTLGVRVIDNAGATTIARVTAGVAEYPAGSGIYAKTLTAPTAAGQYTIVWDDGTNYATDDLVVTFSAPADIIVGPTYATTDELARILKLRTISAEQQAALERVLVAATGEIDSEIDLAADAAALAGWQLQLAAEVCLERAVEHWEQGGAPFGIIGLGAAMGATHTATDSWNRHANKLVPLKNQWGLA